jgi:uncharacterized protein YhaN
MQMTKEQLLNRVTELEAQNARLLESQSTYDEMVRDLIQARLERDSAQSEFATLQKDRAALMAIAGRAIVTSGTR